MPSRVSSPRGATMNIRDLSVAIDGRSVLAGVTIRVRPRELHVFMGPNGSGKSTLAQVIAGNPNYTVDGGSLRLGQRNLLALAPDERARLGLFVAFQQPLALAGVSLTQFLRLALEHRNSEVLRPSQLRERLSLVLPQVGLPVGVLEREVNVGFSGGEQKRFELAQLFTLGATLAVLDEIDSGLDVDGIRRVAAGVEAERERGTGILFITHNPHILSFLSPDCVHILVSGKIVASGDASLGHKVADAGYEQFRASKRVKKIV